jgi:hypothetical protein
MFTSIITYEIMYSPLDQAPPSLLAVRHKPLIVRCKRDTTSSSLRSLDVPEKNDVQNLRYIRK